MAARYTLGIDLGGTTTTLAAVDAHHNTAGERSFPTRPGAGLDDILTRLLAHTAELRRDFPCATAGVAVAAHVDPGAGRVVSSPHLYFADVPLAATLEQELGLPLLIENDVNAAAYGEYLADPAARQPLLAVFVGTGVGGGLIAGDDIFRGADGFASEIGHLPVDGEGGEACGCGRRGCLEAYAGGAAIIRRAAARSRRPPSFESVDDVVGAAEAGSEGCREVLEEAAEYLGRALAAAVNLLNPGTLILGGGVARAWPPLRARAFRRLEETALPASLGRLERRETLLGARAGVVGVAALARESLAAAPSP